MIWAAPLPIKNRSATGSSFRASPLRQTARETGHSPEAVTRYVKGYKRILACLNKGLTPKDTAFVAKVSENLVYEYIYIAENQLDIKGHEGVYGKVD